VILLVLLASVPLCCCRVSLAFSMFAAQAEPGGSGEAASLVSACCAGHHGSHDAPPSPGQDADDEDRSGCDGPCCLKGFMPSPEIELPSADLLAFVLPASLGADEAQLDLSGGSERRQEIDGGPPPDDPAERTLVRQRCLLLI
jgi:hypothetical protein